MNASSDYQKLRAHLAFLRMTAAAEALPGEPGHAARASLTHAAFLERILAVEAAAADERRRVSLERFASLPSPFTLADSGFSAQPPVDPKLIADLGTLRFIEDATNVLLIGPPGVGKTSSPSASATPRSPPACGSTTPPPPTSPPAATALPSKDGGPPPCGSTPDPVC
jgi:DNA replication protein DnaC